MALAKQAALAKRTRPDNHFHSFRRRHQEVRDQYAIAYRSGVDLVGAYSNPPDQPERLHSLLDLPRSTRPTQPDRPPKQAQNRLDGDQVAQLVAVYQAGGTTKNLAIQFGIHRDSVRNILQREGVKLRLPGVRADDLPEVIRLYTDGWSLRRLALRFDVSPSTVTNTLRKAGVRIRPPGRRALR